MHFYILSVVTIFQRTDLPLSSCIMRGHSTYSLRSNGLSYSQSVGNEHWSQTFFFLVSEFSSYFMINIYMLMNADGHLPHTHRPVNSVLSAHRWRMAWPIKSNRTVPPPPQTHKDPFFETRLDNDKLMADKSKTKKSVIQHGWQTHLEMNYTLKVHNTFLRYQSDTIQIL